LKSEPRCLLLEIGPPSLANLERPGNEGRYGPVGESIGWVETPNLSPGDIHNSWEARARFFHDLNISWQPLRRWLGLVPAILKVAPIITPQQAVVPTATIFPVSRFTERAEASPRPPGSSQSQCRRRWAALPSPPRTWHGLRHRRRAGSEGRWLR